MQTATQSPVVKTGICQHCGGKKFVMKGSERRSAVKVTCYHCRGTGRNSPGYSIK